MTPATRSLLTFEQIYITRVGRKLKARRPVPTKPRQVLSAESRPQETLRLPGALIRCFPVDIPPEEGAWLEAVDGRRHPIRGSCSLGRTPANAIVLDSPKVSRRHALIHLQNIGELWLIDFGSS